MNFRFFKIPVHIDFSFWPFLLLVLGTVGIPYRESILLAIVIVLSVLVHEYGHAKAALFFGADPMITLHAFGGKTVFNRSNLTAKQDFFIILAGPLLQGCLLIAACLLLPITHGLNYYFTYFILLIKYSNSIWLVFNLLPLMPLDGGWLVQYLLEHWFGRKGYRAGILIGLVTAVVVTPYLYFAGYQFFFIYLLLLGFRYCKLWQEL